MGSGFAKKKKQAKMLQEQFAKVQEQMKLTEVHGSAGGGLVTITLNGENDLTALTINPECVDRDDVEGLELLIKAAYNEANEKLKEQSLSSVGGAGLPNLAGFGF